MRNRPQILLHSRRLLLALLVAAAAGFGTEAAAQSVVAVVNGDPITSFDIDQRSRLIQVSMQRNAPRQEVLNELIDEKLKLQLLRRFQMDGIDIEVENTIASMARRSRMSSQQFLEQLTKANISPATLKSRIKAEIIWGQIVRGRYQSRFLIPEQEIVAKLESSNPDAKNTVAYDYTLRPILFIVPRGSPQNVVAARIKEAEALRARFDGCTEGIRLARTLRDVAIRPPVVRHSGELAPPLREMLDKTALGKLSGPEVTLNGVEIYALCGKRQSSAENAPGRKEIRDQMVSARFQEQSKLFLSELRSQAMIEYK